MRFQNETSAFKFFERSVDGTLAFAGVPIGKEKLRLPLRPSSLRSVFEKLRFRDVLVWTAGLRVNGQLMKVSAP